MKSTIITSLLGTGVAVAMAVAVWMPANTSAQVKGGQLLVSPPSSEPAAAAQAMACPKCQDQTTTKVDATVRGSIKPTVTTTKHMCGGCDTTVKVTGTGKNAKDAVSHSCNMSGKTTGCCN